MTDDQPIACAIYSDHELAILQHRRLRLPKRGADSLDHGETLLPEVLPRRDGVGYLSAGDEEGGHQEPRLDWIAAPDPWP